MNSDDTTQILYLQSICAEHTRISLTRIEVNAQVNLKLIRLSPAAKTEKPVVLFVAGWVTQISAWEEVLAELTKEYEICYLETREKVSARIRGKAEYGVEDIGRDIAAVLEKLDLRDGQFILAGSSLGATAILDSCQRTDRHPLALVLIGPNAVFRVPKTWIFIVHLFYPPLYNMFKPAVKWYLRNFRLDVKTDYEQYRKYCDALDAADPRKLKKGVLKLAKYEVWDILEHINIPTLIIGASKDALHEPENLKRMTSMLPEAEYIDLETNKRTHSRAMVEAMKRYFEKLSLLN